MFTSFWWKQWDTNHKLPHSSTLIVFLRENELFQRSWGVFVTFVEIPRGWGVISSLQKWKIQGGGGVLSEIPSVVGVWIFSGTTQFIVCMSCHKVNYTTMWKMSSICLAQSSGILVYFQIPTYENYKPLLIFQNCLKFHSPNSSWNYV